MRTFVSAVLVGLSATLVQVSAAVISFNGEDLNAGQGSAQSNSSAASFSAAAAALGTVSTIAFEGIPTRGQALTRGFQSGFGHWPQEWVGGRSSLRSTDTDDGEQ